MWDVAATKSEKLKAVVDKVQTFNLKLWCYIWHSGIIIVIIYISPLYKKFSVITAVTVGGSVVRDVLSDQNKM